jgi:hypothetical protein
MDNDEIWKCEDGRRIPVGELTEDHAKNILRMILRQRRERRALRRADRIVYQHLPDFDEEDRKWCSD